MGRKRKKKSKKKKDKAKPESEADERAAARKGWILLALAVVGSLATLSLVLYQQMEKAREADEVEEHLQKQKEKNEARDKKARETE